MISIISKTSPEKRFAIEVKATKQTKSDIPKVSSEVKSLMNKKFPVLMMYIDYDKEKGYFEIINSNQNGQLEPLESKEFDNKLKQLAQ